MPAFWLKDFGTSVERRWNCHGRRWIFLGLLSESSLELHEIEIQAGSIVVLCIAIWGGDVRFQFGDFALDTDRRELQRGAKLIPIGPQVFDTLVFLLENRERVVSKDDLLAAVWQGRIVSESTLTSHMNAVRKVIGDSGETQKLIRTFARKGFRFVGEASADQAVPVIAMQELPLPDKPSIAVLPFQNLSGDPEQEYFADGVVEDIITGLSRIKWLFVIARNSSFIYKGQSIDVKKVGRELGVRYVLEGSVRRAENRIRINCQLNEAESGGHLWAERYDREMEGIFSLQDEITLSTIGAIEPTMRDAEIERVKRKRPDNLDAYDLMLRALPYLTSTPMPHEAQMAMPFLEQALTLEPGYARAHGLLSWCHEILYLRAGFKEENRLTAIRHGRAAILHGRDDANALALGAFNASMIEHDRTTAFETFDRALSIAPFSAFTLFFGAIASAWAAKAEQTVEWGERALRLSPFDRMTYLAHHAIALAHFLRGRDEESANAARRAVQASPDFSICHLVLSSPLVRLGRMDEAKAAATRVLELQKFSSEQFCNAFGVPSELATPLTDAWTKAGLPP
jgi:TolB-like protein